MRKSADTDATTALLDDPPLDGDPPDDPAVPSVAAGGMSKAQHRRILLDAVAQHLRWATDTLALAGLPLTDAERRRLAPEVRALTAAVVVAPPGKHEESS